MKTLIFGTALAAAAIATYGTLAAQHAHEQPSVGLTAPAALTAEHEELHRALAALLKLPGKTGEAARQVEKSLHPHFLHEEEFALPQLGLLHALASGQATSEMRNAITLSDRLQANLPKMLAEHKAIVSDLEALARAAKGENHPQGVEFAHELTQHAEMEEQVLYPAAVLVGKYLRTQLR